MGKGSSTPAPDPALVAAQVKSLGIQDDAIQRMMAMSESLAPLQKQQLMQSIDQTGQLWAQAQDDRAFALGKRDQLSGIQNAIVGQARAFNEGGRADQLAGQAMGDVNQAFSSATDQQARALQRTGVNPNDGRYAAAQQGMAAQQGLALASASNRARDAARQEGYALTDRANNALAGYPSMSMQGQTAGLQTMSTGMNTMNQGVSGLMAPSQAISQSAGQMGSNAASMYGQQASAYNASQAADASNTASAGAAIGTAASLAVVI